MDALPVTLGLVLAVRLPLVPLWLVLPTVPLPLVPLGLVVAAVPLPVVPFEFALPVPLPLVPLGFVGFALPGLTLLAVPLGLPLVPLGLTPAPLGLMLPGTCCVPPPCVGVSIAMPRRR